MKGVLWVVLLLGALAAGPSAQAAQVDPPWAWSEAEVTQAVNRVRAGRDLNPGSWPGGARVAVLLSFDVDNETLWLRNGDTSVSGLSQGEYGSRVALGRILRLLDRHKIPASFFGPAMSFSLAPSMIEAIQASGRHEIGVHGWIHERKRRAQARGRSPSATNGGRSYDEAHGQATGWVSSTFLELLGEHARAPAGDGLSLRFFAHGRRSALRAAG